MKNKTAFFFMTFFLISAFLKAQENEIIVPVIKSPYPITSPQWDATGESFSYTTNGKVYVRDFSSLSLQDSFPSESEQNEDLFSSVNSTKNFPDVNVSINKNKVILSAQDAASSQIQTKEISTPVMLKGAAVNKKQNKLACIDYNDNAFIYDIEKDSTILNLPQSASCKDIQFLDNDNFLFCDSNKTVSLYSSSGQKLKTYTNSNNISGFSISPDNDNLVIFDDKGVLNFYSITDGKQYGYSPSITSSIIQDVSFNNDSKKVLIKTNNSLYTATVSDILYAQNSIAPSLKEFPINYNSKLIDTEKNYVTEYNNSNIKNFLQDNDAEYITTTQEKEDDNQYFSYNKKPTQDETIALVPFVEQEDYPATPEKSGKSYYFYDSANSNPISSETTTTGSGRNYSDSASDSLSSSQNFSNGGNSGGAGRSVSGAGGGGSGGSGASGGSGSGSSGSAGDSLENHVSSKNAVAVKDGRDEKQKETKTEDKENKKKEKYEKLFEKWKNIKEYNDENIKTLFKDGHGLMFNLGICKTEDLFPLSLILPMGYRNYDLLRPFYFGGSLELDLGFPSSNFPYKYYDSLGEKMNSPLLVGFKLYAPFGACMYPLKNGFEVFGEFGMGIGFSGIWSGGLGSRMLLTKLYPSFFVNFRTGVAWNFLNLTFNFSYDAVTGMAYGVELGAIINIGGTRTIGNMIKRKKQ